MGGLTGRTKDNIILAMHEAELCTRQIYVKDIAEQLKVKINTISGHLRDLHDRYGYVRERDELRGRWGLTGEGCAYAESLRPRPSGISYRGIIAAGPAVPIMESIDEPLVNLDLDPQTHFAMRVRGDSMVSYDILDGDLVIFRRVSNWLEVGEGKIVAARVPEGTGVGDEDWLAALDRSARAGEGAQAPALDHGPIPGSATPGATFREINHKFYTISGSPEP